MWLCPQHRLAQKARQLMPTVLGLSQTFSDQCASGVRRRDGLTFGYGSGFQTPVFLSTVVPIQVQQSETPLKIVREKTLRQARLFAWDEGCGGKHGGKIEIARLNHERQPKSSPIRRRAA